MRTKVLLVTAAVLMLIVSLVAIGSNMGFKISIPLTITPANNWVSIPYYNNYTTASSIFADITGATQVSRWDNATSAFQSWTGTRGTNFAVTTAEAYLIKVSAAGNWIVVGSHNPGYAVPLTITPANNWISVPYHTTATTAGGLFAQLPSATQVSRWDNATSAFQSWTGTRGTNFTITAGEGLLVKVSAGGNWTPAHY
jgi:hypothetical protein